MGRHWQLRCPYCKSEILSGWGFGDKVPQIYVPFIRCNYCGKLLSLGSKEFLNFPPEERKQLANTSHLGGYIEQSLDRTNNREYVEILLAKGFKIYPVTDEDRERFTKVDFDKYENRPSTDEATQSLYNAGILIDESRFDVQSGTFKKEILEKNQKNYKTNLKANAFSGIVGIAVGLISCIFFGEKNPNSYLFLLGILFGLVAYALTFFCVSFVLNRKKNKDAPQENVKILTGAKPDFSDDRQNLDYLKKLRNDGIITEEEYKDKVFKIIDNIK